MFFFPVAPMALSVAPNLTVSFLAVAPIKEKCVFCDETGFTGPCSMTEVGWQFHANLKKRKKNKKRKKEKEEGRKGKERKKEKNL